MNQIIMILLISMLVLVHEIGHFIAARLCGIRVTRFGIGMPIGPSWKMFKWGHTNFYLHAFLFGGYVSFPDDIDENDKNVDKDEILPSDSDELYENKTIAQKLFVVSAGVVMNIVFAIILVIFCASYYHKLPASTQNIVIDSFVEEVTSNIKESGVQKGDKIIKVNNQKINSYYQLVSFVQKSKLFDNYAEKDLFEKNLEELKALNPNITDIDLPLSLNQKIVLPDLKAEKPLNLNSKILKGLEKYKQNGIELNKKQIKLRDEIYNKKEFIISDNENTYTLSDIALTLSDSYKPIELTIIRNNEELTFSNIKLNTSGALGIKLTIEDNYIETTTFKSIVLESVKYIYTTTVTMIQGLWQLITGKISGSDMHGIIAIVKIGGDVIAAKGMLNGILLTAMISINLAIMNFLPIPALDGGHVMFLVVEKLTGKKPTKELGEKINSFFFILLILLMVVICYNDIYALITKKF